MFTKKIYLIRHGETLFNKLKMVQGSGIDSELNETGKQQAWAFYEKYKHIPFDKIYTSKLQRTHQTIAHFVHHSKIPTQQLSGLNEISWGNKEGRLITIEDDTQYQRILSEWRNGKLNTKHDGGESPIEVMNRQKTAWKYIVSNHHEKTILVCMHGRAIRVLLCMLSGISASEMDQFKHSNTCLYVIHLSENAYHIEIENDTSHLRAQAYEALSRNLIY